MDENNHRVASFGKRIEFKTRTLKEHEEVFCAFLEGRGHRFIGDGSSMETKGYMRNAIEILVSRYHHERQQQQQNDNDDSSMKDEKQRSLEVACLMLDSTFTMYLVDGGGEAFEGISPEFNNSSYQEHVSYLGNAVMHEDESYDNGGEMKDDVPIPGSIRGVPDIRNVFKIVDRNRPHMSPEAMMSDYNMKDMKRTCGSQYGTPEKPSMVRVAGLFSQLDEYITGSGDNVRERIDRIRQATAAFFQKKSCDHPAHFHLHVYCTKYLAWRRVLHRVSTASRVLLEPRTNYYNEVHLAFLRSTHCAPIFAADGYVQLDRRGFSHQACFLEHTELSPFVGEETNDNDGDDGNGNKTAVVDDFISLHPLSPTFGETPLSPDGIKDCKNKGCPPDVMGIRLVHAHEWQDIPELQPATIARGHHKKPAMFVISGFETEVDLQAAKTFVETLTCDDTLYTTDAKHGEPPMHFLCRPFCFLTRYTPQPLTDIGNTTFLIIVAGPTTTTHMDRIHHFTTMMLHDTTKLLSYNRYWNWEQRRWVDRKRYQGFIFAPREVTLWSGRCEDDSITKWVSTGGVRSCQFVTIEGQRVAASIDTSNFGPATLRATSLLPNLPLKVSSSIGSDARYSVDINVDQLLQAIFGATRFCRVPSEVWTTVMAPFLSMSDALANLVRVNKECFDALRNVHHITTTMDLSYLSAVYLNPVAAARAAFFSPLGTFIERAVQQLSNGGVLPLDYSYRRLHPIELRTRLEQCEFSKRIYEPWLDLCDDRGTWVDKGRIATEGHPVVPRWKILRGSRTICYWDDDAVEQQYFRFQLPGESKKLPPTIELDDPNDVAFDEFSFEFYTHKDNPNKRLVVANVKLWYATRLRFNLLQQDSYATRLPSRPDIFVAWDVSL